MSNGWQKNGRSSTDVSRKPTTIYYGPYMDATPFQEMKLARRLSRARGYSLPT